MDLNLIFKISNMVEVPDETFYFLLGHWITSFNEKCEAIDMISKVIIGAIIWKVYMPES